MVVRSSSLLLSLVLAAGLTLSPLPSGAQALPILWKGGASQLDIRAAGAHAVRITLKPVDFEGDFPFTPALDSDRTYPEPALSFREVGSPVEGSPEVTRLISQGWEEKTGGKLEFEPDWRKMVEKALAHIDAKRKALKLEEYDPTRYAQSQVYLPADYAPEEVFKAGSYSLKA